MEHIDYSDGSYYDGEVNYEGEPDGYGELHWADGAHYAGYFVNGKIHGRGTMRHSDNTEFTGELRDGEFFEGKMVYTDGRVYEGHFKDGNFEGHGKFTYTDGSSYEGEFSQGQFHGKGIFRWASSEYHYEGPFVQNCKHGRGLMKNDSTGEYYYAEFKNDSMVDPQIIMFCDSDGQLVRYRYTNGEFIAF